MLSILSPYKIKKSNIFFCEDIATIKASNLTGINRNAINQYFNLCC